MKLFDRLFGKRFHSGGVVRNGGAGLRADEVPAVLSRGSEQWPYPGERFSRPSADTVTVIVQNKEINGESWRGIAAAMGYEPKAHLSVRPQGQWVKDRVAKYRRQTAREECGALIAEMVRCMTENTTPADYQGVVKQAREFLSSGSDVVEPTFEVVNAAGETLGIPSSMLKPDRVR